MQNLWSSNKYTEIAFCNFVHVHRKQTPALPRLAKSWSKCKTASASPPCSTFSISTDTNIRPTNWRNLCTHSQTHPHHFLWSFLELRNSQKQTFAFHTGKEFLEQQEGGCTSSLLASTYSRYTGKLHKAHLLARSLDQRTLQLVSWPFSFPVGVCVCVRCVFK